MISINKLKVTILIFVLFTPLSNLNGQNYSYQKHYYLSPDSIFIADITVDKDGNEYSTGIFWGTRDFDLSSKVNNKSAAGYTDIFIQKTDSSNNLIWVKTIGIKNDKYPNTERAYNIAVDDSGNVYTTGEYSKFDLDPDGGTKVINGYGVYLLKLNNQGQFKFATLMGDTSGAYISGSGIAIKSNNIYVCGKFKGQVNFKQGVGTANRGAIGYGGYVVKYDANGNYVWSKIVVGKTASDHDVAAIFVDQNEKIYFTGLFSGDATLEYPIYTNKISAIGGATDKDIYIAQLDKNGNLGWVKSFGSLSSSEVPTALFGDKTGYIYLGGNFTTTIDFNPSTGTKNLTPLKFQDGFISKFAPNGDFINVAQISSSYSCGLQEMIVNNQGDIIIAGILQKDVDFDPSANQKIYTAASSADGSDDFYIEVMDDNLNMRWAKGYGTIGKETITKINFKEKQKEIMLTGIQNKGLVYNGSVTLNSTGTVSLYLKNCITSATEKVTTCDYFKWKNNITYRNSQSGITFLKRTPFACDSILNLDLKIHYSYGGDTLNIRACDEFKWVNNEIYTESAKNIGARFNTIHGCDSFLVLNLTINKSSLFYNSINSCEPITWLDGKKYDSSNNKAYIVLKNSQGCDSTIRLNFNKINVNKEVTVKDGELISKENEASKFQWLDCENQWLAIPGKNSINYKPEKSGNYGVEIFKNGCTDTSICTLIEVSNAFKFDHHSLYPYPNPTSNNVYFNVEIDKIDLFNVFGAHQKSYYKCSNISLIPFPKGIYIMKIFHAGNHFQSIVLLQ